MILKKNPKNKFIKNISKKIFCQIFFQKTSGGKAPLVPAGPRLISSDSEISAQYANIFQYDIELKLILSSLQHGKGCYIQQLYYLLPTSARLVQLPLITDIVLCCTQLDWAQFRLGPVQPAPAPGSHPHPSKCQGVLCESIVQPVPAAPLYIQHYIPLVSTIQRALFEELFDIKWPI